MIHAEELDIEERISMTRIKYFFKGWMSMTSTDSLSTFGTSVLIL